MKFVLQVIDEIFALVDATDRVILGAGQAIRWAVHVIWDDDSWDVGIIGI